MKIKSDYDHNNIIQGSLINMEKSDFEYNNIIQGSLPTSVNQIRKCETVARTNWNVVYKINKNSYQIKMATKKWKMAAEISSENFLIVDYKIFQKKN